MKQEGGDGGVTVDVRVYTTWVYIIQPRLKLESTQTTCPTLFCDTSCLMYPAPTVKLKSGHFDEPFLLKQPADNKRTNYHTQVCVNTFKRTTWSSAKKAVRITIEVHDIKTLKIFLMFMKGSGAKSYMRKGYIICEEMRFSKKNVCKQ